MQEKAKNPFEIEADFLLVCTGINACRPLRNNGVFNSFKKINPNFVPPETRQALIFELKPGEAYLKKVMNKEIFILVAGSKTLDLDHAALIPKKDYLTIAVAGKSIDKASLPEDTMDLIQAFMALPGVKEILPGISFEQTPIACACTPLMAVTPAISPYTDRIGFAGDAMGARLFRDGLFSAFTMTGSLARTLIHIGTDKKSLSATYDKKCQWLEQDNIYGKRVMALLQFILKSPILSRILYQSFATEMKFKTRDQWPMGKVLWQIGSGAGDYKDLFKDMRSVPVLISVMKGAVKTLRNILTELVFGLKWGRYGRYPTVILKEKRDYIKSSIKGPLDIKLDNHPDMERMYAIKIRASASDIYEQLGRFGTKESSFLRLRFVGVNRVAGSANQADAVVRYKLKRTPIAMDIRLVKSIKNKALWYEPAELFNKNGKLLFDISPTTDGNNRLVVYTAFDYKQGRTFLSRIIFRAFRLFFPDFAHDVVWNHALCCIKGDSEKKANR